MDCEIEIFFHEGAVEQLEQFNAFVEVVLCALDW